jgi:hypothetical protein
MSNFHFDLSLKLSQGEVHDFLGEVQNNLRGGAHLPSKSGHGYNYLKNTSRTSTVFFRQLYPYQFVASKYTFHLGFLGGGGHMF